MAAEYPDFRDRVQRGSDGKASGELTGWAEQGALLLNASLTVLPGHAGSHSGIGWRTFTARVIAEVTAREEHAVFLLWGAHARGQKRFIDESRHTVIETAHPSPLSAHRGFLGSGCFRAVNDALELHGHPAIDWALVRDQSAAAGSAP